MDSSVTGQSVDSRSYAEGQTIVSDISGSSNRVIVEQLFPQHARDPICVLPEHPALTGDNKFLSKDQYCTVDAHSIDLRNNRYTKACEVDVSAFLALVDPDGNHIVELCCNPDGKGDPNTTSFFRFEFEDDIRKIQVLPLPLNTYLDCERTPFFNPKATEALGILLLVVAKRGGMSVHSLVLTRKSEFEHFQIAEFMKVSRGTVEDVGTVMELSSFLDQETPRNDVGGDTSGDSDPILYVAISACPKGSRSSRIDCLACPMVCHKCPLFRSKTLGPTRALKRSLVLTGTGNAHGVSITIQRQAGVARCSVGILFEREMKLISLPSLARWNKEALRPEDIVSVPFGNLTTRGAIGPPSWMVPIPRINATTARQFAILCRPSAPTRRDTNRGSSPLSPTRTIRDPGDRDGSPVEWTTDDIRQEIDRARQFVMSNVNATVQEDALKHTTSRGSQDGQMPTPIRRQRSDGSSDFYVVDENFETTFRSSEMANVDMSGRWASSDPSEFMSHLDGLGYVDEASSLAHQSQNDSIPNYQSPQPREDPSEESSRSERLYHILIIEVMNGDGSDPNNKVKTQVLAVPPGFSNPEALAFESTETELILVAKPRMSPEVRILHFPLSFDSCEQSKMAVTDRIDTLPLIRREKDSGIIHVLGIETLSKGRLRIHVIGARRTKPRSPADEPNALVEHFVELERKVVSPPRERQQVSNVANVEEKLDLILKTLLRFESNVNERLRVLEQRTLENAARLNQVEESPTRVEI